MPCTVESASLEPKYGFKFVAAGEDMWIRVFDFHTGEEIGMSCSINEICINWFVVWMEQCWLWVVILTYLCPLLLQFKFICPSDLLNKQLLWWLYTLHAPSFTRFFYCSSSLLEYVEMCHWLISGFMSANIVLWMQRVTRVTMVRCTACALHQWGKHMPQDLKMEPSEYGRQGRWPMMMASLSQPTDHQPEGWK